MVIKIIIRSSHYKQVKFGIHYLALSLSIASVIYTLIQMTDNRIMQYFFVLFALFVELFAQFIRGLASSHAKLKQYWSAGGLWAIYMLYIVVFAFLSAVGVFVAETNLADQKHDVIAFAQQEGKKELRQANQYIATLQAQLDREGGTGTGPRFKYLQDELDRAITKRDALKDAIKAEPVDKSRSVYSGLHDIFTLPANWFKILMFGSAVIMIYLALIITPWQIDIEDNKPVEVEQIIPDNTNSVAHEKKKVTTLAQMRRERDAQS